MWRDNELDDVEASLRSPSGIGWRARSLMVALVLTSMASGAALVATASDRSERAPDPDPAIGAAPGG